MKIDFYPAASPWDEDIDRNRAYALGLGLPRINDAKPEARPPLALVGGGPSIVQHVNELRAWPGEVWAINGAAQWCREHGIDAALFTIERQPATDLYRRYTEGVTRAVLATICRPELFDFLLANHADIRVFDLHQHGGYGCGTSTATAAPIVAFSMGHHPVHLFGCESSWRAEPHAYGGEPAVDKDMLVACGGTLYRTTPAFAMQAQVLAHLIRELSGQIVDRSGGLLAAMAEHGAIYDILQISPALRDSLEPYNDAPPRAPAAAA